MAISEEAWAAASKLLADAEDVALACHVDPDGDALGSMLAMQRFLRARGATTVASFGVPVSGPGAREPMLVPPQYTFLPGLDDLTPSREFPQRPRLLVALDTGSPERLGSLRPAAEQAEAVIVLDHHASGYSFGDVRLVDGDAAATAVIVDEWIRRMGGELDREMAVCLYVGLITDTARFQNPTTTPAVMELGARLLSYGIDHAAINRQVWDTHSFGYLKVMGRALGRAAMRPEAGLAWTAIYQRDLEDLGITLAETEGLIDVLRAVEAADCTMVLKELRTERADEPRWRVSLRSKGAIDIGTVAARLSGGGHTFAAGFSAIGELEEVVERVVAILEAERAPATVSPAG
jgi:bifunctional oligoribonuclease and PAP phosphatase NrnA